VERLPPSNDGDDEMKTTIDMAREAGAHPSHNPDLWDIWEVSNEALNRLVALVRADEREEFQRWFDAVTAQHKQLILAEREACAKVCESLPMQQEIDVRDECAAAIRNRGNK
jgi:hypothetical protein